MGAIFPSSRALPATVAVASVVLALKLATIITAVPALASLGSGGAQVIASAVEAGGSAWRGPLARPPLYAAVPTWPEPPKETPPLRKPTAPSVVLAAAPVPVAEPRPLPLPVDPPLPAPDALKLRRSQIEDREHKLAEREAMMVAADKRLVERIGELTALQARLQALEAGLKERDDANWAGMVKTYETMRPRDAAAIFNALDKPVLLDILDRMKPAKATPVIAAMDPEKARQATANLSERRTRSTTVPD